MSGPAEVMEEGRSEEEGGREAQKTYSLGGNDLSDLGIKKEMWTTEPRLRGEKNS